MGKLYTVLTFGDSNTHGSRPGGKDATRFDQADRWPQVMLRTLGKGWHLCEEGLPGRTTCFDDILSPSNMDGRVGLRIALMSHAPVDFLTIMLGTNDLQIRFAASAETIIGGIAAMCDIATADDVQARNPHLNILLICPPPILEVGVFAPLFLGGAALSLALPAPMRSFAKMRKIAYLDAGKIVRVSPEDGVHLDATEHHRLGQAVADRILTMAKDAGDMPCC